jgi:hypothetical protein
MRVRGKILVREVFASDKGVSYITGVDMDTGGDIKFSIPGVIDTSQVLLQTVNFEANLKGRNFNGSIAYQVINGELQFSPIKS